MRPTPGGYVPKFPISEPEPNSLTAKLSEAHAKVIAVRREFLARKGSASGSLIPLSEELISRLERECVPAVRIGRQRIAEVASKASSPEVTAELDDLAGKRFWNGHRDPLTSPVEVTDGAIQLTLDWLRERGAFLLNYATGRSTHSRHLPGTAKTTAQSRHSNLGEGLLP